MIYDCSSVQQTSSRGSAAAIKLDEGQILLNNERKVKLRLRHPAF